VSRSHQDEEGRRSLGQLEEAVSRGALISTFDGIVVSSHRT
jgi:hypothetical protein